MHNIWTRLQQVKQGLKNLKTKGYSKIGEKVEECRKLLAEIQVQTRDPNEQVVLAEMEKEFKMQLEKWISIDESILKQKSRVKWLHLGDSNNAYFFACMKNRVAQNQIRRLNTLDGNIAHTEREVETEILKFYQSLLGSAATCLPTVQLDIFQEGNRLIRDRQLQLIAPMTAEKIFNALMDIDDQTAPRCDDFNAYFFKIIWQVITKRMKALMPELVNNSQSVFVLGTVITDNIILGHELVKGYGRKGISPRCMLKIDMQKAYDSVEWVFIEQGDKTSMQLLFNCVREFSRASRHTANLTKSSIYFGGVNPVLQQHILAILGFSKGELPFRYLGVPLSSMRLSITQCQPLIDKMLGKITSWTMTTCRRFLWIGDTGSYNKALLAWKTLCYPMTTGAVNFVDVEIWNRAAICKQLWNLCKKKDRLWVRWVHAYYGANISIWEARCNQASWLLQKIVKASKYEDSSWYGHARFDQYTTVLHQRLLQEAKGGLP
ncbi:uncharacterized protein LOC107815716 [Nicotiana tabacum]|uniref:Uncharacterized protein LOC107815716 n=1 Tax=Nicotiana tabacum TaxID=4097 RepID=A0AC58SJ92_TOBAC